MYIHAILVLIVIMFTSHLDYAYLCCCQTALNHFLIKRLNSEPSKSHVSFSVVLQKGKYAYDVKCALLITRDNSAFCSTLASHMIWTLASLVMKVCNKYQFEKVSSMFIYVYFILDFYSQDM